MCTIFTQYNTPSTYSFRVQLARCTALLLSEYFILLLSDVELRNKWVIFFLNVQTKNETLGAHVDFENIFTSYSKSRGKNGRPQAWQEYFFDFFVYHIPGFPDLAFPGFPFLNGT